MAAPVLSGLFSYGSVGDGLPFLTIFRHYAVVCTAKRVARILFPEAPEGVGPQEDVMEVVHAGTSRSFDSSSLARGQVIATSYLVEKDVRVQDMALAVGQNNVHGLEEH